MGNDTALLLLQQELERDMKKPQKNYNYRNLFRDRLETLPGLCTTTTTYKYQSRCCYFPPRYYRPMSIF